MNGVDQTHGDPDDPPDDGVAATTEEPATDHRAEQFLTRFGIGITIVTAVAALVYASAGFFTTDRMMGDMVYHRGVALGLQRGGLVGEDFFAGHTAILSGFFHLLTGQGAAILGVSWDALVSVGSWFFGPLWVGALVLLGRRLFVGDWFRVGLLVFLGTFGASISSGRTYVWGESLLPFGHVQWPVFPRDIALLALLLAAWSLLSPRSLTRVAGTGFFFAVIITTHAQLGVVMVPVLMVAFWFANPAQPWRRLREVALIALVAVVLSTWWWWAQLQALRETSDVVLGNWPGRVELSLDLEGFVRHFGFIGVLALVGFGALLAQRAWRDARVVILVWFACLTVLLPVSRVVGGDLFPERRLFVLLAPALVVFAAEGVAYVVRRTYPAVAVIVVGAIVVSSLPALAANYRAPRNEWGASPAVWGREYGAEWDAVWKEANSRARDRDSYVVATYEGDAAALWSFSGAQVPNLWLAGQLKLGFEPAASTGFAWSQRFEAQREGFARGIEGVCGFAQEFDADAVLLERADGRVGTHEVRPATDYRPERAERTEADLMRPVASGVTYVDQNSYDLLRLDPGGEVRIDWENAEHVDLIRVRFVNLFDRTTSATIDTAGIEHEVAIPHNETTIAELEIPPGRAAPITVRNDGPSRFDLVEIRGFEPVDDLSGPDGPFLEAVERICR